MVVFFGLHSSAVVATAAGYGQKASRSYGMGTDIDFKRRAGSKNVYLVLGSTGGIYVFNDVPSFPLRATNGLASSGSKKTKPRNQLRHIISSGN